MDFKDVFNDLADRYPQWIERIHLLASLDEQDRALLLAFSMEGKTTRQIADEMKMTDGQVRIRLHRIRRRLRKGRSNNAE